jgi:hypothetical protein
MTGACCRQDGCDATTLGWSGCRTWRTGLLADIGTRWVEAQFLSQRIRPPDPRHGPAGKSESSRSCRSCRLRDPGCWEPAGPACPLGTGCSRRDSGFLCQLRPDAASVGRAAASDGRGAAYGTPQAGPLSQVLKWAGDHAGARHRVAPRRSLRGQWAACRHQLVGINGGPMSNADCCGEPPTFRTPVLIRRSGPEWRMRNAGKAREVFS